MNKNCFISSLSHHFLLESISFRLNTYEEKIGIMYVFTQPLHTTDMWHKVNFNGILTGINLELSFS